MAPVTLDPKVTADTSRYSGVQSNSGFAYGEITFGEYVFRRLLSCGTKSVFGVPGDFNLALLEHLYDDSVADALRWVGNCNELNAAYAADGYSRYTNKIGCLITTYGVGELSALNGVAGSFAEDVKVLHIVGVASSQTSCKNTDNKNVHHLIPALNDSNFVSPNHKTYYEMVKDRVCCAAEYLEDIDVACDMLDKVIEDMYRYSKPGYLFIPADFADMMVSTRNLVARPTITLEQAIAPLVGCGESQLEAIVAKVAQLIYNSSNPCILGDVLTDRYGVSQQLNSLISHCQMWNFSTVMGKSVIDESNPYYKGLYNGRECSSSVIEDFSKCDLILHFGIERNEINNGHYTIDYNEHIGANVVEFHSDYIRFFNSKTKEEDMIRGVNFVHVLNRLQPAIQADKLSFNYQECSTTSNADSKIDSQSSNEITQEFLQDIMPQYLNPGDVLVCETGSVQFGVRDYRFPSNVKYVSQGFYLSIGMALPASLGVGIGMQDYPMSHIPNPEEIEYEPKLILFEGDGSAQMTIQELSTMLHNNVKMEIFLWNNDGYTIERAIKGPTRSYNDIAPWNWTKMFEAFGDGLGSKHKTRNQVYSTREEFLTRLREKKDTKHNDPACQIELLEVKMGVLDFPEQLKCMVSAAMYNKKKEQSMSN
ncbi:ARO10 [Nakaseomyces glabratus]|uniref:Thiamine pyrophosphate-dependent 2-oxo-acid decarboxylase n=1 Tax=Candida glabrata (strain ATCC 2001 / BCRC 20586 / JCM 3761 / NBRC 0622 / NRRL Y-65 / CBS 138) TaxID=284593 RepID=Q6FYB3_CANGA|nr:uncharacterized protein CAGL0A03102g [Nakaseomyces glabratus]KAH7591430.1 Thiamine pyrophosphate enzyme, C-terminal TPP binding domain [Nakaseomyces glabratus]KAH7609357.1 Thiamine pyrophosphate enzyme, C-terminal TPP binding domain [Nakaseomyces glabratus]KAH7610230.1 Thiamine pyrophosphate enzyme, C-terminal TPP binding domain [Nakaseomyces glabratus]KAH7615474.1 Thiamine pyrophosphate enzyme, C-terminal TPP binding domain [Nakaseomyces glabratus]QHS64520.1 ARO10 [Nakaseomyces glabratus]|eukprot:XP_444902.1 uncharacterized protein CAGL0A03102g [[Candida] glabrata]